MGPWRTKHPRAGRACASDHDAPVKVRITRKFAEFIDGVDLRARRVGDVFEVSAPDAALLLAEQWAVPASASEPQRVEAADPLSRSTHDVREFFAGDD